MKIKKQKKSWGTSTNELNLQTYVDAYNFATYSTSGTTTMSSPNTLYNNIYTTEYPNPVDLNDIENKLSPEEESLGNVGFKYNKETNKWGITMEISVELPTLGGVLGFIDGESDNAVDEAVKAFKKLKERILRKLTAKIVFMELTRSHVIKV